MHFAHVPRFDPLPQRDEHGIRAAQRSRFSAFLTQVRQAGGPIVGMLRRPLSGEQVLWTLVVLLLLAFVLVLTFGGTGVWN